MNLFKSLGTIAIAGGIVAGISGIWFQATGFLSPDMQISAWIWIGVILVGFGLVLFVLGALMDRFELWREKRQIKKRRENVGRFTQWD